MDSSEYKILIVDDVVSALFLLKVILRNTHFSTFGANRVERSGLGGLYLLHTPLNSQYSHRFLSSVWSNGISGL